MLKIIKDHYKMAKVQKTTCMVFDGIEYRAVLGDDELLTLDISYVLFKSWMSKDYRRLRRFRHPHYLGKQCSIFTKHQSGRKTVQIDSKAYVDVRRGSYYVVDMRLIRDWQDKSNEESKTLMAVLEAGKLESLLHGFRCLRWVEHFAK